MKDSIKNWIIVGLALVLGALGGWGVAYTTVTDWYDPPPPPELLEANRIIMEHCHPTQFRIFTCPDRTDICMCQPVPPEMME